MDRRSFLGGLTASLVVGCAPTGEALLSEVAMDLALATSEQARLYAPDGGYVVLDTMRHEVVRMSQEGNVVHRLGGLGAEAGKLNGPRQFAFAPNGDVWILDGGNRRLQRFDASGRSVAVVPVESASAFAVRTDGQLVVSDAQRQTVQVLHPDGRIVIEHSLPSAPRSVAVGADGRIVVATYDGGVLSIDREVVELVPAGTIGFSQGIAVHADGRVLVGDGTANAVRAYTRSGRAAGVQYLHLDDGRVAQPLGLQVDARGLQVVVQPGEA